MAQKILHPHEMKRVCLTPALQHYVLHACHDKLGLPSWMTTTIFWQPGVMTFQPQEEDYTPVKTLIMISAALLMEAVKMISTKILSEKKLMLYFRNSIVPELNLQLF